MSLFMLPASVCTCPISATLRCTAQFFTSLLRVVWGCAIAQAISRRFSTAPDRLRSRAKSCGICGEQSGTGGGFLRVLRFLLPIFIPSNAPYSSIIRGWYNGPACQVGSVSPRPNKLKKNYALVLRYLLCLVRVSSDVHWNIWCGNSVKFQEGLPPYN
jgi:hypothetical protein